MKIERIRDEKTDFIRVQSYFGRSRELGRQMADISRGRVTFCLGRGKSGTPGAKSSSATGGGPSRQGGGEATAPILVRREDRRRLIVTAARCDRSERANTGSSRAAHGSRPAPR